MDCCKSEYSLIVNTGNYNSSIFKTIFGLSELQSKIICQNLKTKSCHVATIKHDDIERYSIKLIERNISFKIEPKKLIK